MRLREPFLGCVLALLCSAVSAKGSIAAKEAAAHVGEHQTVCGTVASAKYLSNGKGSPTFLNLDAPYPNQIFTVVIWGDMRPRFSSPPESLMGEAICATGVISLYRGTPEIVVNDPGQITR